MDKPTKLYVIEWIVNGKVKEVLNAGIEKPFPFTAWFIKENKYIYTPGLLKPRCTNAKEVAQWERQKVNRENARKINTGK
jgi:hypothetical protein